MPKANLGKKPTGFRLMPEGDTTLLIKEVKGLPRANVTNVEVTFVDEDGITLKNKYDLTSDGGYAAFYYLVTVGCGFEVDDEFDIDAIAGKFVDATIVHKEGNRPREDGSVAVFANIARVNGKGTPFATEDDGDDEPDMD